MIFLIVLLHAHNLLRLDGFAIARWDVLDRALATIRVPTFFLISGLFARRYVDGSWRRLAHRKLVGQLRLYVAWSAIYVACAAVATGPAGAGSTAVDALTTNGEGWYLLALPLFFGVTWLAQRFRVPVSVQVGVAAALALTWFLDLVQTNLWGVDHMAMYFVFFVIGVFASDPIRRFAMGSGWVVTAVLCALWTGLGVWDELVGGGRLDLILKVFLTIPGVLMVVAFTSSISRWKGITPFAWMGRHSLPVYVAHPVALAAAVPVLVATPAPQNALPLVAAAVAVAASYLVWWLLRRPVPWLFTATPAAAAPAPLARGPVAPADPTGIRIPAQAAEPEPALAVEPTDGHRAS